MAVLSKITYQNLRFGIEVIGNDVQVTVIVQVKDRRRSRAQSAQHRKLPGAVLTIPVVLIRARAVHIKPRGEGSFAPSGLNAQDEFAVQKSFAEIVQEKRIDSVTKHVVHTRRDENVLEAVSIQIIDTNSPGPIILHSNLIGDFREFAVAEILVKGVPPNALL